MRVEVLTTGLPGNFLEVLITLPFPSFFSQFVNALSTLQDNLFKMDPEGCINRNFGV